MLGLKVPDKPQTCHFTWSTAWQSFGVKIQQSQVSWDSSCWRPKGPLCHYLLSEPWPAPATEHLPPICSALVLGGPPCVTGALSRSTAKQTGSPLARLWLTVATWRTVQRTWWFACLPGHPGLRQPASIVTGCFVSFTNSGPAREESPAWQEGL